MLNAKLKPGMTLMQVITLTQSLGERVSETPETWAWADDGESRVTLVFEGAKLRSWQLARPEHEADRPRPKIALLIALLDTQEPAMSMADRDGKIWMDGELVEWRDAKIHVLSHTLHYGCGAFEGVRAYNTAKGTAIFRLREHTERLFNSAKILRMKIPFTHGAGDGSATHRGAREQAGELLPAPAHLDRLREAGRQPQGQQDPPDGRRLVLGRLPG